MNLVYNEWEPDNRMLTEMDEKRLNIFKEGVWKDSYLLSLECQMWQEGLQEVGA
jgi:hypothetical protein